MSKAEMLKAISVRPLLLSFVRGVEDLYDTSTEQPAKVCRNASFSELFDNQNDIFVPRQARDNHRESTQKEAMRFLILI